MKKHQEIIKKVLENIKPSKEELNLINNQIKEFIKKINQQIKKEKIDAQVFLGGSFAKKTAIKKGKYDADLFVRYGKKHLHEDFSIITARLLKEFKGLTRIHGSRDYFVIEKTNNFSIEIIPVKKIKKSSEAENITDLSYSHVNYINKKIKSEKILDEIRIAKAFCHATNCYGAESYIRGFSGYGLELLIYHYKNFFNLAKAVISSKDKIIIDIEKEYKGKSQILLDLNSSKLSSPIILIDPTYKQRNVLAALSQETFEKFKKECKKFIEKPSLELFEDRKENIDNLKKNALSNNESFVFLQITTYKQAGDIAGSKLLKFFNYLKKDIEKSFQIKKDYFYYEGGKNSKIFLSVKPKKEKICTGPLIKDEVNTEAFKKKHTKIIVKKNRIYALEEPAKDLNIYLKEWIEKNMQKISDMSIEEINIL